MGTAGSVSSLTVFGRGVEEKDEVVITGGKGRHLKRLNAGQVGLEENCRFKRRSFDHSGSLGGRR